MLLFNRAEGRQLTNHDREIESLAEEGTDDRKNTFTLMNEKHSTNNCWIKNMLLTTVAVVLLSGCSYYRGLDDYRGRPKLRKGAVACQSIPNKFIGVEEIGPHRYQYSFKEKVGIVYTDKAGHIDIGHLRKSADWTAYLSGLCRQHLSDGRRQWQYELTEPTRYSVRLTYPPLWEQVENKEVVIEEVAMYLGAHLAYTGMIWHEMLTWFGYSSTRFMNEFGSSFSWEDNFSNLLGVRLSSQALKDKEYNYNDAMTFAIDRELDRLGGQSMKVARQMAKEVKGRWYTLRFPFFLKMIKRNLDIGEDGDVVSVKCHGNDKGESMPVPHRAWEGYGFKLHLELAPTGRRTRGIRKAIMKNTVVPKRDFTTIIDIIEQDAMTRGYDCVR